MNLKYFDLLSPKSQKAMLRVSKAKGWNTPYYYEPKGTLLRRLAQETGATMEEVRNQLIKEREYLLNSIVLSQQ